MAGSRTEELLQYLRNKNAAGEQYLREVIPEDKGETYDTLGEDGLLNSFVGGAGNWLADVGTITKANFGFGDTAIALGKGMAQGRQVQDPWSVERIQNDPFGYITSGSGLRTAIGSMAGSMAPDFLAMAAVSGIGALAAPLTGGASAYAAAAFDATRAAKWAARGASFASKATKGEGLLSALVTGGVKGGKVIGTFAKENAAGAIFDAAAEGGGTYRQAMEQGGTHESALEAANTAFLGNTILSTAQFGTARSMAKGAGRIFRGADEAADVANAGGSKVLNSISEFGGKVSGAMDSRFVGRLAKQTPGLLTEGYTEMLQNELQNYAINDTPIQYNPFNAGEESTLEFIQATAGMSPLALLGAARRRRPRVRTQDSLDTAETQGPTTAPGVGTQPAGPTVENTVAYDESDMDGALTQEEMDSLVTMGQAGPSEQSQVQNDNVDLNTIISNNLNNPSDYSKAESALYMGDNDRYPAHQAIADAVDSSIQPLGYNPVHGERKMTGSEKEGLTNALINSPDFTMINNAEDAKPIVDILQKRNDNKFKQARAQSLIQQKQDLGLEVSQAEIDNANSISPNVGFFKQQEIAIRERETSKKQVAQAQAEQATAKAVEDIERDIKEKGTQSDFYAGDGKGIPGAVKARLEDMGVSPTDKNIKKAVQSASKVVADNMVAQQKAAEKSINETIVDDLKKNGTKSRFYTPDGKIESLPNQVRQEIMQGSGGKVSKRTLNRIAALSSKADKNEATRMEKDRVMKGHLDQAAQINNNPYGVKINLEGLDSRQRAQKINSTKKEIAKRQQKASIDAIAGYEQHRIDKGMKGDTTRFAVALSKLSKKGQDGDAAHTVALFVDKFFKYQSLSMKQLESKFPVQLRDDVKKIVKEYVNGRTREDFKNEAHVSQIEALMEKASEIEKKKAEEKVKAEAKAREEDKAREEAKARKEAMAREEKE